MANCPQCGTPLNEISYPRDSYFNRDQWESMRAGDWYCTVCPSNERGKSSYAYFWDQEVEARPATHQATTHD